jgi:hypothetical protein
LFWKVHKNYKYAFQENQRGNDNIFEREYFEKEAQKVIMTKILNEIHLRGGLFSSVKGFDDHFPVHITSGEVFHSCRLTILDTRLGGDAKIVAKPKAGMVENGEVVVEWQCEGSAMVKYQIEAFSNNSLPSIETIPVTRQMTDFLPSANGFHFDNLFEKVPPIKLIGDLRYGDASKGLCGGMVFAALDYFTAGLEIPTIPPEDLSAKYKSPLHGPIFDYFGKRLFSSFDVPTGVWNFIELMHPKYPDFQARNSRLGLAPRSRAWRMVRQEWPSIKERLDIGQPCSLGLVRIKSTDLSRLGENHQVMAYGYDLVGDDLTLFIYDPNYHDKNVVTMKLNIGNPEEKVNVSYFDNGAVYCFFRTNYVFSIPPGVVDVPGRAMLFEDEKFCGKSIDVVRENPDLGAFKEGNFDDRTSSVVILSGNWSFYRDRMYAKPFLHNKRALVFGPGNYARVSDIGIQDNEISSLRVVEDLPTSPY